jgi:excisionase family DNA binding protein
MRDATTTTTTSLPNRNLSVAEFCTWSGLCRTTVYKIIGQGDLRPLKYGRRTLIPAEEALRWRNSLTAL